MADRINETTKGVYIISPTPFDEQGAVDFASTDTLLDFFFDKGVTGIFGGDFSLGLKQLAAQAIGVVVIWTVIFGIAFAFFKIQNALMKGGIRASVADELEGMDVPEMGLQAYPVDAAFSLDDVNIDSLPAPQQEEVRTGGGA